MAAAVLGVTVSVVGATPAHAAVACDVTYTSDDWTTKPGTGGFTASIIIRNLGEPLNGWTLGFAFPAGQRLTKGWGATWSQSGSDVSAIALDWNRSLAGGASAGIGLKGTWSGGNPEPTAFTVNGVPCGGTSPAEPRVDNPFAGATGYVNPDWSAKVAAEAGGAAIANTSTAVWLDRVASITGGSGGHNTKGLREHLDLAVRQDAANGAQALTFQVVIYNLPNRDCQELTTRGDFQVTQNGLNLYKTDYIDVIAGILAEPAYRGLRIVTIVEPNSLPNLITNLDSIRCQQAYQSGAYVQGVAYALGKLHAIPNVYNYLDAGNHGWLGGETTFAPASRLYASTAGGAVGGRATVHGFVANTAGYAALTEPHFTSATVVNGRSVRESAWVGGDFYVDESSYVRDLRQRLILDGFATGIGMLIDTSRNGWGGPARPTAPSTSTDVDTFVDESRVDRRIHENNWCNQSGAGLGERPRATPAAGVDAYVWIKPPGESDGLSSSILDEEGRTFDRMCDPTYPGNPRNGDNPTGALPGAPAWGRWFPAQFQQLLRNAYPAL
ncbi:glucanase [Acrocarpospora phusangensis]|uniref:Glucanase n=2 Tax=Acrocarpospora phusangensis TaxID=1070424 RepID=A0A919QG03_9ACTN|nr:glucanase [Acrocarpospora phusangensis]